MHLRPNSQNNSIKASRSMRFRGGERMRKLPVFHWNRLLPQWMGEALFQTPSSIDSSHHFDLKKLQGMTDEARRQICKRLWFLVNRLPALPNQTDLAPWKHHIIAVISLVYNIGEVLDTLLDDWNIQVKTIRDCHKSRTWIWGLSFLSSCIKGTLWFGNSWTPEELNTGRSMVREYVMAERPEDLVDSSSVLIHRKRVKSAWRKERSGVPVIICWGTYPPYTYLNRGAPSR